MSCQLKACPKWTDWLKERKRKRKKKDPKHQQSAAHAQEIYCCAYIFPQTFVVTTNTFLKSTGFAGLSTCHELAITMAPFKKIQTSFTVSITRERVLDCAWLSSSTHITNNETPDSKKFGPVKCNQLKQPTSPCRITY